jgi:hypothetical protein
MSLAIAITAKYMYAYFSPNTSKRLIMMFFELLVANFGYFLKDLFSQLTVVKNFTL